MRVIELTDIAPNEAIPPGIYRAKSLHPAYGQLRALVTAGEAKLLGERYLLDGEKELAVLVDADGYQPNQSEGEGEGGTMIMGPDFFAGALDDYSNWKEAWWREAIQNGIDAGATEILCTVKTRDDGGVEVTCEDNGSGMDKETLRGVFMRFKGTGKKGSTATTGGFGEAKRLLVLPWISYEMHTRDVLMKGSGSDYKTFPAPMRQGTRLTVVMPSDNATSSSIAMAYIGKCSVPGVRFIVDGERVKADLRVADKIRDLQGAASLFYDKKKKIYGGMVVRIHNQANGASLAMFTEWVPSEIPGQLIVEIYARSTEVLTSNRDGFRGNYGSFGASIKLAISQYLSELSADVSSALRKEKGLVQKKYDTGKKFQGISREREAVMLDQLGAMEPLGKPREKSTRELSTDQLGSLIEALSRFTAEQPTTEVVSVAANAELATAMMEGLPFSGAQQMEAACRQLAWQPDYFLVNEVEGYKVPKKFYPEHMTAAVRRLVRCWAEMCRFVLIQLGSKEQYGVGLVIAEDRDAEYRQDDGHWLMLNPFVRADPSISDEIWSLSDNDHFMWLYAAAVHECTHMADGVAYHNESFASAVTKNFAKCSGKEKQLRAIKRIVSAEEKKLKDERAAARPRKVSVPGRVERPRGGQARDVGFVPPEPGGEPYSHLTGGAPFEYVYNDDVVYYGNLKGVTLRDPDANTLRYEVVNYDSGNMFRLDPRALNADENLGELNEVIRAAFAHRDPDEWLRAHAYEYARLGDYARAVAYARWNYQGEIERAEQENRLRAAEEHTPNARKPLPRGAVKHIPNAVAKPKVTRRRVTVTELADSWRVTWDDGSVADLPTAFESLEAIKERDASSGESVVTVVTWEPTTRVGSAVVRALTALTAGTP
jgi:hypothetical protein